MAVLTSVQDFFVFNSQSKIFELIQKFYVPGTLFFLRKRKGSRREHFPPKGLGGKKAPGFHAGYESQGRVFTATRMTHLISSFVI